MTTESTNRELITTTVTRRASHEDKDRVGDTRSFANMKQTLTREYWGRFLIEMLQNARDAWLAGGRDRSDGVLRIRLTRDPVLLVCNEGRAITADVILDSIAKFGESTKRLGEGIGHKGIGFKSVLELTHAPRVYSRADAAGPFDLRVLFDPDQARRLIYQESPDWVSLVAQLASASGDPGGVDRVPILRFPIWDETPPPWLADATSIGDRGFNTVIAMPYDQRFDAALDVTRESFQSRVRDAFAEVSDAVILLLGVFSRIVIEDEGQAQPVEITRLERALGTTVSGATLHEVEISRNGALTSRWWLFRRSLADAEGISGELGVALRVETGPDGRVRPLGLATDPSTPGGEDCFHLFFPTRIRTHLPFLLHAYFDVDAGRKGFAEDRVRANTDRLDGLRSLAVDAVGHLASIPDTVDLEPLAALFAATAGTPEVALAASFRERLLADLDSTPWVAVTSRTVAAPSQLIVEGDAITHSALRRAFPAAYVERRLARAYPLADDPPALAFLADRGSGARTTGGAGIDGESLLALLHPHGGDAIWDGDPDTGFGSLLELLDLVKRRSDVAGLLETLRTNATASFIPVIDGSSGRRLRAPGRDSEAVDDEGEPVSVGAILARVTETGESPLAPPRSLGLDFVRDGLLDAEQLAGIGAKLGIRPYLTEVILDALARAGGGSEPQETLPFVWRLLLRERARYSVQAVLRQGARFAPGAWFWARGEGNSPEVRDARRRERALAGVLLPTRDPDATWQPATELVFGADWADWLDAHAESLPWTAHDRASAYRELEAAAVACARPETSFVASPAIVTSLLQLDPDDLAWEAGDAVSDLPKDPEAKHGLWSTRSCSGWAFGRSRRSGRL